MLELTTMTRWIGSQAERFRLFSSMCFGGMRGGFVLAVMLLLGMVSEPIMAGQPSFSSAQAKIAQEEGVPIHRVILMSITLERTEVVGDMIIEHYRYGYLILPEDEAMPYEPTTLDEAQAFFDQRQHAINLHAYVSSQGVLPAERLGLPDGSDLMVSFRDPWDRPYEYQRISDYQAIVSSLGQDGLKGTADDLNMPVSIDPLTEVAATDADAIAGLMVLFFVVGGVGLALVGLIVGVTILFIYLGKREEQAPLSSLAE